MSAFKNLVSNLTRQFKEGVALYHPKPEESFRTRDLVCTEEADEDAGTTVYFVASRVPGMADEWRVKGFDAATGAEMTGEHGIDSCTREQAVFWMMLWEKNLSPAYALKDPSKPLSEVEGGFTTRHYSKVVDALKAADPSKVRYWEETTPEAYVAMTAQREAAEAAISLKP